MLRAGNRRLSGFALAHDVSRSDSRRSIQRSANVRVTLTSERHRSARRRFRLEPAPSWVSITRSRSPAPRCNQQWKAIPCCQVRWRSTPSALYVFPQDVTTLEVTAPHSNEITCPPGTSTMMSARLNRNAARNDPRDSHTQQATFSGRKLAPRISKFLEILNAWAQNTSSRATITWYFCWGLLVATANAGLARQNHHVAHHRAQHHAGAGNVQHRERFPHGSPNPDRAEHRLGMSRPKNLLFHFRVMKRYYITFLFEPDPRVLASRPCSARWTLPSSGLAFSLFSFTHGVSRSGKSRSCC